MKKFLTLTGLTVIGLMAGFAINTEAQQTTQGVPTAQNAGQGLGANCEDFVDTNNSGVCDNYEAGGLGRGRDQVGQGRGQGPGQGQGLGQGGQAQGQGRGLNANTQGPGQGQGLGQGGQAQGQGIGLNANTQGPGQGQGLGQGGQAQGQGRGRGANAEGRGLGNRGNQNANFGQGREDGWQPRFQDADGDGICDISGQVPRQQAPRDGQGRGRSANR